MALRAYILNNFWAKLFSLVLATMIWGIIHTWQEGGQIGRPRVNPTEERTFYRQSITVMKSAADDRGFRVTPATVDIAVNGPRAIIRKLSSRDIEAFVNLTDILEAEGLIKKIQVFHPPDVSVTKINPPHVRVERVRP